MQDTGVDLRAYKFKAELIAGEAKTRDSRSEGNRLAMSACWVQIR